MNDNRYHDMLCVGGPLSGLRRTMLAGQRLRTVLPREPRFYSGAEDGVNTIVDRFADYKIERFSTRTSELFLLTPEEQTAEETLRLLVSTYEAAHK